MKHLDADALLAYWLHETDDAATAAADEHLLQCEACGDALERLIALGEGVRAALRAGALSAVAGAGFVQRLADQGLRVREYRLAPEGSVQCAAAPEDDLLVLRLSAPLRGVTRLDLRTRVLLQPEVELRMDDLPFDADSGEVLIVQKLAAIRQMPDHIAQVQLVAVEPEGPREVGRYTLVHRAGPPR